MKSQEKYSNFIGNSLLLTITTCAIIVGLSQAVINLIAEGLKNLDTEVLTRAFKFGILLPRGDSIDKKKSMAMSSMQKVSIKKATFG